MRPTWRINTREFDRTLDRYRQFSKRTIPVIVNTKAFYIARRAVLETPRVEAATIRKFFSDEEVAGKVINKRMGPGHGLYGQRMRDAIMAVLDVRLRSRAFLASGWLRAVKYYESLAERIGGAVPRKDRTAKEFGRPKGEARASGSGYVARAMLANMTAARWDRGGQARIGKAALQRAFDAEVRSMKEYIQKKMNEAAFKAGVKTVS